MSTIKVEKIQHPNAVSASITLDSNSNLAFPAGSASTPAIQGPGDSNTGLFFPAADTIAFTGGGTEVLRIDSSGRLGLGTSNPVYKFDLQESSSSAYTANTEPPNYHTRLYNTDQTTAYTPAFLNFGARGSTTTLSIWYAGNAGLDTTYSESAFVIGNRTGASSYAERLRITGAGNVGIGTTSPAHLLSVSQATGDAQIQLGSPDSSGANSRSAVIAKTATGGGDSGCRFYFSNHPTSNLGYLAFNSSQATERARIDSSGRLLVGTSSASGNSLFQVEGNVQHGGAIYSYASKSWSTAAAAALFDVKMSTGHCGAALSWMMVDISNPNGVRTGTLTIAVRGSGTTKSAVAITQVDGAAVTSGTLSTLTWSAAISSNEVRLTATPSTDSGTATVYLWGSSPFFTSDGITAL